MGFKWSNSSGRILAKSLQVVVVAVAWQLHGACDDGRDDARCHEAAELPMATERESCVRYARVLSVCLISSSSLSRTALIKAEARNESCLPPPPVAGALMELRRVRQIGATLLLLILLLLILMTTITTTSVHDTIRRL